MNANGHGLDGTLFDRGHELQTDPASIRKMSFVTAGESLAHTSSQPEQHADQHGQSPSAPDIYPVFGEPSRVGDKTIIPVASVKSLSRFSGKGIPFFSQATPVALIEVDDGVRVTPIANKRLPALTWALMLVWIAYWLLRTLTGRFKTVRVG
jgi:hypothetical protein